MAVPSDAAASARCSVVCHSPAALPSSGCVAISATFCHSSIATKATTALFKHLGAERRKATLDAERREATQTLKGDA